ncbi:MAG: hypothetical protein CL526_08325 [Aequorivita sp.]|nr:hypothetical protein [Aequorivita sp.]|tara:strand:- start:12709 stop:13131 length:423 start_codon:yes stop_codon:yes gene_type:complete
MKNNFGVILFFCFINTIAVSQNLQLYGGADHNEYLGCIDCSNFDLNSIWNPYSNYGNKSSSKSIWNPNGIYGNEFNFYSPWNKHSSIPPIVKNKDGEILGYFTVNKYKGNRANFELAITIYSQYQLIREDVDGWYKKIFE